MNDGRRLIIYDGHDNHISAKFIAHCMHYKIKVVLLPPHSSHLLQSADVAVFDPLKTQISNEQLRYIAARAARLPREMGMDGLLFEGLLESYYRI
jgi:hypothetical protein